MPPRIPILIAGAGPTGLTLACELARRDVSFRIVDRLEKPARWDRATAIKTRTLEVFAAMRLIDCFLEQGLRISAMETIVNGDIVSRVSMETVSSPYPFMLSLSQEDTERILTDRLRNLGVTVERGLEFKGLEESDGLLQVLLQAPDGKQSNISTDWLVGCDGGGSAVRATMNAPLEGFDYPDSKLLAIVRLDGWSNPKHTVTNFIGDGWRFNCQEMPNGTYLLSGTADDAGSRQTDTHESLLDIWQTRVRNAMSGATISEALWLNRFHIRLGVAPVYRKGHVLIAGDAAHQFSPEGASGMNTGIQDAFNLAWKLALVSKGCASASLLGTYEEERRPIAELAGHAADRAEKAMQKMKSAGEFDRKLAIGTKSYTQQSQMVASVADLKHNYRRSPISHEYRAVRTSDHHGVKWPVPWPGDRLPDASPLIGADGSVATLHQLAWVETLTLLLLLGNPEEHRLDEHVRLLEAVTAPFDGVINGLIVVQSETPPHISGFAGSIVCDPSNEVHQCLGVCADTALVVRPDGYVAYRGEPPNRDDLLTYIGSLLQ